MAEGLTEPSQPDMADAANVREIVVSRIDNCLKTAEAGEQSSRRDRRDVRDRCEHGFDSPLLRPLRVERPIARTTTSGGAAGDAIEPEGRVRSTFASYHGDPNLAGGEQRAPDRCGREWAVVERRPFDEKVRRASCGAKPTELSPDAAGSERQVQIAHGLSLDERTVCLVVPDRQAEPLHVGAEPAELLVDGPRLVHVHIDADHLNPHAEIVPSQTLRVCTYRAREARTS